MSLIASASRDPPSLCHEQSLEGGDTGCWGGGVVTAPHNTTKHPGFNEKGDAAPLFPRHAASDRHHHAFITSFLHCKMNVPSSSPPSPPPKVRQIWERAVKGAVPFAATTTTAMQPPPPSRPPCPPSARCRQQPWGGQPPAVMGFAPPGDARPPSTQLLLSSRFRSLGQARRRCSQSTRGDVATGHFVI